MKKTSALLIAAVLLPALRPALVMADEWTGNGNSINWSDPGNWDSFSTPSHGSVLYFSDLFYPNAYTNVAGVVNNVVNTSRTVGSMIYNATYPTSGATTNNSHFYTTLIPGGVTLTLTGDGAGGGALMAGDVPDIGNYFDGVRTLTTVTGAGSLVLNDPAGFMYVGLGGANGGGSESAVLNMSSLNNFSANLEIVRITALNEPVAPSHQHKGELYLARTNTITAAGDGGPGILLGVNRDAPGTGLANMYLGQVNFFKTTGFVVGGAGAYVSRVFMTNVPGSTFKLRGMDGVAPVPVLSIADQSADAHSFDPTWKLLRSTIEASLDFRPGTVDIQADSIFVGRSSPANAPNDGTSVKNTTGIMTVGDGTVTTTNLYVGHKLVGGTNINAAFGTLNLASNTVFTVYQDVYAAYRTNTGIGQATFNISNKAVLNVAGTLYQGLGSGGVTIRVSDATNSYGGIVLTNVAFGMNVGLGGLLNIGGSLNGFGNTAIALTESGRINMTNGGNIVVGSVAGNGIINAGSITVSNSITPGATLTAGTVGSLFLSNNLIAQTFTNYTFDLSPATTTGGGVNDYINVAGNYTFNAVTNALILNFPKGLTAGTYTLMDYGSKSGANMTWTYPTHADIALNQTASSLQLVVNDLTTVSNLVWRGATVAGGNLWNITSNHWFDTASAALGNYYQLDHVTFDDTALTNSFSIPADVQPSSVTFNNTTKTFTNTTGSGRIIGATGLTKNGTGRLILSAGHDFFGPVQLNGGITMIGSSSAFGSTASTTGTVAIASGATIDLSPGSVGSTTSARKYTMQGVGVAGLDGAIYSTNNATLNNSGITLAGDTSIVLSNNTATANAGRTLALQGMTHPTSNIGSNTAVLDLGGYTFTALSTNIQFTPPALPNTITGMVSIVNMRIANGSINVPQGCLNFGPAFVDGTGPGAINLGNNTILRFSGFSTFNNATGYVAKAINIVSNTTLLCAEANPYSIPVSSAIAITGPNGLLHINSGQAMTFSGPISGAGALTKNGTGRLTLNGANTYTGPLTINNGGLTVGAGASFAGVPLIQFATGINGNILDVTAAGLTLTQPLLPPATILGNITTGNGSTLVGNTTISGSLTIAAGSEVAPGGTNVTGSVVVTNDLSLAGGHLTWEITPSFETGDRIIVGGNLNLSGLTTFKIGSIGGFSPDTTNTLITYTGTLTGGLANITNINPDARFVVQFIDPATTPGKIQVVLTVPPANLTWKGDDATNPTWWDLKVTTNWLNGGTPDVFWSADGVTFDDTSSTGVVDLRGSLIGPNTMQFNNASKQYVFHGSAGLIASSLTNDGAGGVVISNRADNQFVGAGLSLNTGTITFAQPTNATLTGKLTGMGTLAKAGTNTLTVVSADSSSFIGNVAVNAGTLRNGSANALGDGTVTVTSGATLDLNGQVADLAAVSVGGAGLGSLGAIDNRSTQAVVRALSSLVLSSDTTLAATVGRWDITTADTNGTPGTFHGDNFNLTKVGTNQLWISTLTDTDLGNIDITNNGGRLVFAGPGTQLGNAASTIIVRTNAQLGFANGIQAAAKNVTLQPGGSVYVSGATNLFSGSILMNTNGSSTNAVVWTEPNAELTLSGNLSGAAGLHFRSIGQSGTAGRLILTGTNTYTGTTRVTDGILAYASSNAFVGTNIVMAGRSTANISGWPTLQLLSNVVSPASVRLEMNVGGDTNLAPGLAYSKCELTGEGGTWGGPIYIGGSTNKQSQVYFSGGSLGLTISGPINGTNFVGSTLDSNGGCHLVGESASATNGAGPGLRFDGPLNIKGSVLMTQTGLGGFPNMTKLILGSAGNNWDFLVCQRGMIQLGAHNAIPLAPIQLGHPFPGGDHRVVFDLNGYNQAIASLSVTFSENDPFWFGNSSTASDSVLTYAGTGTNLWSGFIVDALDTNAPIQKATALSVTSGYLMLRPQPEYHLDPLSIVYPSGPPAFNMNPYTGPTIVTGGTLHVNRNLGPSPVTVTAGMLCGSNGVFLGPVTIAPGGTIAPGQPVSIFGLGVLTNAIPIASLFVSNNLTLGGTCVMDVNLTTAERDRLVVSGSLTYGGTLVINNLGNQPFTNGTVLPLFSAATYVSGAVAMQPASPGPGLAWDTSSLAIDGTLKVVPGAPASAPAISNVAVLASGNIAFTLTGDLGQSYSVLASTNVALPLASWQLLTNGTAPAASWLFIDLNATNHPMRFYRTSTP